MDKVTVFDKASFNDKVRSAVAALESKVENYLSGIMQDEVKSKVAANADNTFKKTLAQFKASVTVLPTTTFPEEVYKVLLARHTVKHKLEIKNIDGTLIKEMEAYIASILGTEDTVKTKDRKSYKVSALFIDAGLATVTDNDTGRQYELTWRSDAAKNSLYDLLGSLKTWSQNFQTYLFSELKKDVRDALIGKWFNALLSGSGDIAKEVYGIVADYLEEGGDATDIPALAADNYSDWLSKLTKKFFPTTSKKITSLRKQCQTLDTLAKDTKLLKEYKASDNLTADTIKGYNSYKKFITAYNELQTAIEESTSNFDSLIPDYIGYKITGVGSDTFNENNATIICATGNNQIEITGSKVSVNAGKGNDTITSGTYDAANSNVKITAGTGDDEIYNYSSNSTIDAGDGADFIRSDSHGKGVSIVGGKGNDTVDSHGNYNIIEGGAGADSISNYGNDVTISGDDGADTIRNFGSGGSVLGGAGDDDILVMGGYVDGGTGVDTIAIQGSNVTAYGGGSFDMLPTKDVFNIASGVSNVYINDFEFGDVLNLPAGTYTARIEFGSTAIRNSSGKLIVCLSGFTDRLENFTYVEDDKQATDGDDSINNDVSNIKIDLGAGDDYIKNGGYWYEDDNYVWHDGGNNVTIESGTGNNTVYAYDATVKTGSGDDFVSVLGGSVNAGDGKNTVEIDGYFYSNVDATVKTGTDDDYISIHDGAVDAGDGNNTVNVHNAGHSHSTVKTGSGDDSIFIDGRVVAHITSIDTNVDAGEGDNTVSVNFYSNSSANVTIKTGSGDDYVSIYSYESGLIAENVDAGEGNNTILIAGKKYDYSAIKTTVKTGSGDDFVSIDGDYNSSINVEVGEGNNTVYAHSYHANGTIKTGAGDDYISGGGSIDAGDGNNTVHGSGTIKTGTGDDFISINSGSINAGDGNDTVYANHNATVKTGAGDDSISIYGGSSSIDANVDAGEGDNTVSVDFYFSSSANITLKMGSGNDFVFIDGSYKYGRSKSSIGVDAGEGNNTVYVISGYSTVKTGTGDDYISGGGSIDAGDGNNTVHGSGTIKTGAGDDYVSIGNGFVDAGEGNDFISISDGGSIDAGKGNDQISLGFFARDNLIKYTAGDGNDTIYGFTSSSTLSISGSEYTRSTVGNDVIITVGDGSILLKDVKNIRLNIDGVEGDPTRLTLTNNSNAKVTLDTEVLTADASARTKTLILVGNELDNTITGGANKNTLRGGDGSDSIVGGKKADKLYGDAGDDTLIGNAGNDTLYGGAGNDLFVYAAGNDLIADYATGDKISLGAAISKTTVSGSNVVLTTSNGTLTIKNAKGKTLSLIDSTGKELETIIGSTTLNVTDADKSPVTLASSIKTVNASSRTTAVKITGNSLANSIAGGSGKDTLSGGAGNDSIDGGAGNDSINGGSGNDCLLGGAGNDKLIGYTGNDTLTGGAGNDSLWGQAGADTFIYSVGDGKDIIYGFDDTDMLEISGTFSAKYYASSDKLVFKVGSTASAITLKNFTATTFHVNGDTYVISGSKFVKTT